MTNFLAIVTAYCACLSCCGKTDGITASGRLVAQGRTVAANHLPMGTRLHIEGVGWRTVEDRMAPRYTGRLDLYFRSHAEARRFGKRRLRVTIP